MSHQEAVVIATYSRRMRLRLERGDEVDSRIKGKRLKPVCGDRVVAEPIDDETDWLITSILDRENSLERPNMRGQIEVLAANVDILLAVAAATPDPDWFIIDRYLSAAENMRVDAAVIYNKIDLHDDIAAVALLLQDYDRCGYPTVLCSTVQGNLDEVRRVIGQNRAIIVGQSGVGKSSILNELTGGEAQRTTAVSDKTGEGRHTTVNSMMLSLPGGGAVIDSPGVRDFAPALQTATQVAQGFREIEQAAPNCRFANCRHLREPDCAVKAGVDDQSISPRRYESYRRLLALTEKLSKDL